MKPRVKPSQEGDFRRHLSIAGGIRAAARRDPGRPAYRHGNRTRAYGAFVEQFDKVTAAVTGDLGLEAGDHGAIVAANSIEYLEIVVGAAQAGIALATINPKLAPAEIAAICEDATARVLFVDAASADALADARISSVEKRIVIERDLEGWLAEARPQTEPPRVDEWGDFTIPYTSGTTGEPKGVRVSHRSRILSMFAMASEYGCFGPDDRFLSIAPMCHGAGLVFSLAPVFLGGYAEIMGKFDPEQIVTRLKSENMTGFFGVPTHFQVMFGLESGFLDANRPESLATVISNAAALPQAMKETLVDHYGPGILHETYGSTEAGIVLNLRPADQLRKKACVGQPIAGALVKLLNADGNECGPGETGELYSSSPYSFSGYWQRPEETAEALHDGWVTVGDMARRDEDGYHYIVDRKKDMVISGGVNIYPREVEEVLRTHPNIKDVAVIGVPHEKWGESLKAFVVLEGAAALGEDAVAEFCEGRISRMKIPRAIEVIDAIPRNPTGKVLKSELRRRG